MTENEQIKAGEIVVISLGDYYDKHSNIKVLRCKQSFSVKGIAKHYLDSRDPNRTRKLTHEDLWEWVVETGLAEDIPLVEINTENWPLDDKVEMRVSRPEVCECCRAKLQDEPQA